MRRAMLSGTAEDSEGATMNDNERTAKDWPLPALTESTGAIYAAKPAGDGINYPDIRIALMDRSETATVPTERDAYLREMVKRCNAYPSMVSALTSALEFMQHVEAKEWENGEAETIPEVEALREFMKSID